MLSPGSHVSRKPRADGFGATGCWHGEHRISPDRATGRLEKAFESVQRIEPARLENPPEAVADLLAEFVGRIGQTRAIQVQFMASLLELDRLMDRLHAFVAQRHSLRPEACRLLDETLVRGEIERGEASRITPLPERSARRVLNDLLVEGILASTTPKAPVLLRFPADCLETLFPRLYPHG